MDVFHYILLFSFCAFVIPGFHYNFALNVNIIFKIVHWVMLCNKKISRSVIPRSMDLLPLLTIQGKLGVLLELRWKGTWDWPRMRVFWVVIVPYFTDKLWIQNFKKTHSVMRCDETFCGTCYMVP